MQDVMLTTHQIITISFNVWSLYCILLIINRINLRLLEI